MENYKEITRKLIDKSFPVLKHKKIFIIKAPLSFFACSLWLPPFIRVIVFSRRTRHFGKPVITGLIAHELCHQERYIEMGIFKYIRFAAKFLTSRNARASEEKATDRLTIEKGYARELYELSVLTFRERKDKRLNELYLPLSEIKSYSESLGNWR